mmetsp:Transcript_33901/g.79279  ORF Transcript_33901/g.79279 Transcript_33901/m.79279 type:complete len:721 (+) Transcript_33901:129-2291(+)
MVNWEETIQARKNPEWGNSKYVDYAMLKRKLERIKAMKPAPVPRLGPAATVEIGNFGSGFFQRSASNESQVAPLAFDLDKPLNGGMTDEMREMKDSFMEDVDAQLEEVAKFYSGKVAKLEQEVSRAVEACETDAEQLRSSTSYEIVDKLYAEATDLYEYVHVNSEALRKIVKKMDKQLGTNDQKTFVENKLGQSALATHYATGNKCDGARATRCRKQLENIVPRGRLKEMRQNVQSMAEERMKSDTKPRRLRVKRRRVVISIILAVAAYLAVSKVLQDQPRAQRCVGLVTFIVGMWVLEAAAFEATALLVPPCAVVLDILEGDTKQQADQLIAAVFNESLYLVLCGYVISSIFQHCRLDSVAASCLQTYLGDRPYMFMLGIMFLGVGLSALISNVTAPIVLLEVLRPALCDMKPGNENYAKALLLGLAFSCNVGGMMTPISSPQNVASIQTLRSAGGFLTWSEWLAVSIPFCSLAVVSAWLIIIVVIIKPFGSQESTVAALPKVVVEKTEICLIDKVSLCGACFTLFCFAYEPAALAMGGTAMVALTFVAVALGAGSITRQTFNGYDWHLLFLIGGGNALGLVVRESGLLDIITDLARQCFSSSPPILIAEIVAILVAATTFVSHTVSALVLMPLVVELGSGAGIMKLSVLIGALGCSTACALPMTSFPNVNSLNAVNTQGKAWLGMTDFLVAGIPTTACIALLLATAGFLLGSLVISSF